MEQKNILLKITPQPERQKEIKSVDAIKAQRETQKIRRNFEQDGYVHFDQETIDAVRERITNMRDGEQADDILNAGLQTYIAGITPDHFQNAIDQAELSREEQNVVYQIRNVNIILNAAAPDTGQQLAQAQYYPDMEIQRTNAFSPAQNNILIEGGKNILFNKAKEKGKAFLKDKGKDVAEKATKKFASKALKEGAKKLGKLGIKGLEQAADATIMSALGISTGGIGAAAYKLVKAILGKVLGWIKRNILSKFKKYYKELAAAGLGVMGLGMLTGSGALVAVGGGAVAAAGASSAVGILGAVSGAFGIIISGFTAATAGFMLWILGILAGFTLLVIFIVYIMNVSSYVVPIGELTALRRQGTLVQSEYMDVNKEVLNGTNYDEGYLRIEDIIIEYRITITAIEDLQNIRYEYDCSVFSGGSPPDCPNTDPSIIPPEDLPTELSAGESISFEYTMTINRGSNQYIDTQIIDTITVTADALLEPNTREADRAAVTIGNPPMECPEGWPVLQGSGQSYAISQGPEGTATHTRREAVDINPLPFSVDEGDFEDHYQGISTHTGTVASAGEDNNGGLYIDIYGNCLGQEFRSRHVHFTDFAQLFSSGDVITKGQLLGKLGNTGFAYYVHNHYEFRDRNDWGGGQANPYPPPLLMEPPYFPVDVRGCTGSSDCNYSF